MKVNTTQQKEIFVLLHILAASLLLMSFMFEPISEVVRGYYNILTSSSNLLTDYMYVGGQGAAFFNAFTILIFSIYTTKFGKPYINGGDIAAIILVTGFAFFGKNVLNSFPLSFGVFLYARIMKIDKSEVILPSLYVTALAPLVSEIMFAYNLPFHIGLYFGYMLGILVGMVVTPLSKSFVKFHHGYNLYNMGFTVGIVAMALVSILRMFDIKIDIVSNLYDKSDAKVVIYLAILFVIMTIYGFIRNGFSIKGYKEILKSNGRFPSDFLVNIGLYPTIINMGIMGIITILFVVFMQGKFNGPIIGGIFSVSAFSAFGKHPKNAVPVLLGAALASILNIHQPSDTSSLLAALFGTTLSPIAGEYGPFAGLVAGFMHMGMVFNIGAVYGGANLYNNGFSGGFIAAILVPLLEEIRKYKELKI